MKQTIKQGTILSLLICSLIFLAACGSSNTEEATSESTSEASNETTETSQSDSGDKENIIMGSTSSIEPILEAGKPYLEEQGYIMEVEIYQDSVTGNEALNEGKCDASFQMHEPYMETFNEEKGGDLVKVGEALYNQQVGLFSNQYTTIDELPEGGTIVLDSSPVNMDRGLKVLADAGLISIDESVEEQGGQLTVFDITENPKNFNFMEVSGSAIVKTMEDADGALLSGQMAANAGFGPDDALALYERDDISVYGMILATKEGNQDTEWAQALYEMLQHQEVQDKAQEVMNGMWTPNF